MAAGLTFTEPVAPVTVPTPLLMLSEVAPLVFQLSTAVPPGLMLPGVAMNVLIFAGTSACTPLAIIVPICVVVSASSHIEKSSMLPAQRVP